MAKREMTAEEFAEYFDNGGDVAPFIDPPKVRFPNREKAERRAVDEQVESLQGVLEWFESGKTKE